MKLLINVIKIFFIIFITGIFFSYISIKGSNSNNRFLDFKKLSQTLAEVPPSLKKILVTRSLNFNIPNSLIKHKEKANFKKYNNFSTNDLLVLSRYDGNRQRSIIEIIDLEDFKVIKTYSHDISSMNKLIKKKNINLNHNQARFRYQHPFLTEKGEILSIGSNSFFKLDVCSNLEFLNQQFSFHHSINIDKDNNFWVPARKIKNISNTYDKNLSFDDGAKNENLIVEDGISKINNKGEVIFYKSMNEILLENNIVELKHLLLKNDPIHINDIQPALTDTKYWKTGDLFISSRYLSSITHYRPSTNKVINYLQGPFSWQHDVDIISDNELSIFNNNVSVLPQKYSEIIIYDFEKNTFKKKFNNKLVENNFYTQSEGLVEIFPEGGVFVEEQNHGRFIIFDEKGNKSIEYVNKDKKGNVYFLSWSRVISDQKKIDIINKNLNQNKC